MVRISGLIVLAGGLAAGAAGGYWYARTPAPTSISATNSADASSLPRRILDHRDPSGAPSTLATPEKDAHGHDHFPVREDEEVSFDRKRTKPKAAQEQQKILYYRNPMGLPDTSPVPKKDWMGMDYIPVYEGEERDDSKTVQISLDKVQRSGVRTETIDERRILRQVRGVGTVKHDDSRLTVVTMRSTAFIEELFVIRTGQHVHAGEPLFRAYSPDVLRAQIDLLVAMRAVPRGAATPEAERQIQGAMQQLRNLGVPEARIRAVRETGDNPRTIDWLSPATGDVIEKRVINGQRVAAGDELFRIADHSHLWVIADVAEADLPLITPGTRALITFRAYPTAPVESTVTFVYPELRTETRTARVRLEVPNRDGRLKIDMYGDVLFQTGAENKAVLAVPASALIDSGTRQVVLVARGAGRFEPRAVKAGRHGDGYVEVLEGVSKGEEVVTSATFLIDAESNLKSALQAFTQPSPPK